MYIERFSGGKGFWCKSLRCVEAVWRKSSLVQKVRVPVVLTFCGRSRLT